MTFLLKQKIRDCVLNFFKWKILLKFEKIQFLTIFVKNWILCMILAHWAKNKAQRAFMVRITLRRSENQDQRSWIKSLLAFGEIFSSSELVKSDFDPKLGGKLAIKDRYVSFLAFGQIFQLVPSWIWRNLTPNLGSILRSKIAMYLFLAEGQIIELKIELEIDQFRSKMDRICGSLSRSVSLWAFGPNSRSLISFWPRIKKFRKIPEILIHSPSKILLFSKFRRKSKDFGRPRNRPKSPTVDVMSYHFQNSTKFWKFSNFSKTGSLNGVGVGVWIAFRKVAIFWTCRVKGIRSFWKWSASPLYYFKKSNTQ